jgi:hypothetical protein
MANILSVITWVVGVLVSLAVGSGMINRVLIIPGIPSIVTVIAGWIVVVGAIISVVMAVFGK